MARRKKTNRSIPAKGRLRDIADRLWSKAVSEDWAHKCAACGGQGKLNSHHLIPRQHTAMRFRLMNGMCLCVHCHQFCADISPHQNAAGFLHWFASSEYEELYKWYIEQTETKAYKRADIKTTQRYYCGIIQRLREYVSEDDYTRILPQYLFNILEDEDFTVDLPKAIE